MNLPEELLLVSGGNISSIMYVDMAAAIGKKINLFKDEADMQETIDFRKLHKTL